MIGCMNNYSHITITERELIFLYLNQGKGFREIGRFLSRSDRTISREVGRNSDKHEYKPSNAHKAYEDRREHAKCKKLDNTMLRDYVVRRLNRGWSPEQIAGRVKLLNPGTGISHETIYKFIYSKDFKDFGYWEFLRKGHTRRQKKHYRKVNRCKHLEIPNRINISARPKEANERSKLGHWETDLMEGSKESLKVVSVLVDRKSGFVSLDMLRNKEALPKAYSLIRNLKHFPASTITFDNGTENHKHELVSALRGCQTYFCNPYHSWEKGTIENTIGLIRSYIPKGTSLENVSNVDLNTIALELNNRPRKRLGYLTPYEVMYKSIACVA